jgi:Rod binding domain-containing protein
MNIEALASSLKLSSISAEDVGRDPALSDQAKVHELCRQFEAVLLRQILSDAQKPVIQSEFTSPNAAHGLYQDMAVNQLADGISRSGSLGFARSLEQQLGRELALHKPISKDHL